MLTGNKYFDTAKQSDSLQIRRIREKYREVFGLALTLPDEAVIKKFLLTRDGDLVMILR